jgi:hypothetical protein
MEVAGQALSCRVLLNHPKEVGIYGCVCVCVCVVNHQNQFFLSCASHVLT